MNFKNQIPISLKTPILASSDDGLIRNQLILRVVGLRRSGLHAILNWLAGLHKGRICFVNDINHQTRILPNHQCEVLPAINGDTHIPVGLDQSKELLLMGYEDEQLVDLNGIPNTDLYGGSTKTRDILVLRDPFNTFASRLHLMRQQPNNPFINDFLLPDDHGSSQLARRWIYLAHEYLGRTQHLSNLLTINFNRWVMDASYRQQICDALHVPFRDDHRNRVPEYGFGSSFDQTGFDQHASSMKLSHRWEVYRGDSEFKNLFKYREIFELSELIFGDYLDHAPLREALEHHQPHSESSP